ncbi:hypothetical protein SCHPADRAFT_915388 [Schizopora paradoxa]|uniref:HIT-type domain-containing protein n=1 Tax=Schizopora paradoxa TaxID=27342 RepID=A0A0H2RM59_9AGAM|nr:hypothetical protein SCHPADRAFT_915388 [Schizopora paradoxa]
MPAERKHQPRRGTQGGVTGIAPDLVAKRTKRHLDELERSNYAEPSISLAGINIELDEESSKTARSRARETISDKRAPQIGGGKKKKSSMHVRTALLYRKNFNTLLEESGISNLPDDTPTYLTAVSPPPVEPARLLCTVCGYWGRYKCRRCTMSYCDKNCEEVHNETRCERRVV